MTDTNEQILAELKELKSWLYGKNGFEGDVPEIKSSIKNHDKRIGRLEKVLIGLAASGGLTGGIFGLIKFIS